jgi:hypothetical protein
MNLLSQTSTVKRILWAAVLGLIIAGGAFTAPMASADTDDQDAAVTIVGGAIAVTNTAALDLTDSDGDDPSWSEDAQLVGDITTGVTVQDHRGSGAGWYLTVESSDFEGSGDIDGESIDAEDISVKVANLARVSGQSIHSSGGNPKGPKTSIDSYTAIDSAVTLIQADEGHGMGTYSFDADYQLEIPALQLSGAYAATVTYTLYGAEVGNF